MKVRLSLDTSRAITVDVKALVREYPDEASEFGIELDEDTDRLVFNMNFRNPDSIDQFVMDAHANGVFDSDDYQWQESDDIHVLYGDE